MDIQCLECKKPLNEQHLTDCGIDHCPCGARIAIQDEALTIVEELPVNEYLGG